MLPPLKPWNMKSLKLGLTGPKIQQPVPLITLTTDFGTDGIFVGCMKGVIYGINPKVNIVDITHSIASYDRVEAAFLVKSFSGDFPSSSIHIVVVDPGVGSARKPLLIQTVHGLYLGPDNGVFTPILMEGKPRVREITQKRYFRPAIGATFHGRDLFAPVAAWLSKGVPPQQMGPIYPNPMTISIPKPERIRSNRIKGIVMYIDHFGNLITNITWKNLEQLVGSNVFEKIHVKLSGRDYGVLKKNYSETPEGKVGALMNSFGELEVFCYKGNAQKRLRLKKGSSVEVFRV